VPAQRRIKERMEIFISHSNKDSDLAVALIELLRGALNIPQDQIRCTSVDGYRLPGGALTEDQLRREVRSATSFIGVITPASIQSAYVLFELGARWGADLHLMPLLAAGIQPNTLLGPLSTLNALSCDDAGQVHQLVHDVGIVLGKPSNNPASYLRYIDSLVSLSKQHVNTLGKSPVIPVIDEEIITQEGTQTLADFDAHEVFYAIHYLSPPSLWFESETPLKTTVKILEQRADGFKYAVRIGASLYAGERFTWKAKGIRTRRGA
jgi:TIR domain-containing protein